MATASYAPGVKMGVVTTSAVARPVATTARRGSLIRPGNAFSVPLRAAEATKVRGAPSTVATSDAAAVDAMGVVSAGSRTNGTPATAVPFGTDGTAT